MGFRFRQSFKLIPGVRLNVGKRGISLSYGIRGASVTLGSRGLYGNVGIPGTGLSYRSKLSRTSKKRNTSNRSTSYEQEAVGAMELDVTLSLQDDGTVKLKDKYSNEIPEPLIRKYLKQQSDVIEQWLNDQCEILNKGFEFLTTIHLQTPRSK